MVTETLAKTFWRSEGMFRKVREMTTQVSTYVDFREINGGVPATLAQFQNTLQQFPRNMVLRTCSLLNSLIASWTGTDSSETQARLLPAFFPNDVSDYIASTGRAAFHRHQLLFVAQEALRLCTIVENDQEGSRPWRGLGIVLLMASDQLHRTMPLDASSAENIAGMIVGLIPTSEANNGQSYLLKMARSYLMLSRFAEPLKTQKYFFDVPKLFHDATGIPLDVYQALLFASMSRFVRLERLKNAAASQDFSISKAWFAGRTIQPEHLDLFLKDLAESPAELSKQMQRKNPRPDDFTLLRNKPLFSDERGFYPFDFRFLAEKFDAGPFWSVNFHLPDSQRNSFHSFWGAVFESYLNWVFDRACSGGGNQFQANPTYSSNPMEQVADGLIVCGEVAILMEYKGSTFTAAGKYGGDARTLQKELESKLVGTQEKRKGVMQLVQAVQKLGRRPDADGISGVDLSGIKTLLPLLVTRDDFGSAFGINTYLNFRFEELQKERHLRYKVPAFFALSVDDIEKISPCLRDTSLADILLARHAQEPALFSPFWIVKNSVLEGKDERKPQWVFDALKELTQMSAERLGLERKEL